MGLPAAQRMHLICECASLLRTSTTAQVNCSRKHHGWACMVLHHAGNPAEAECPQKSTQCACMCYRKHALQLRCKQGAMRDAPRRALVLAAAGASACRGQKSTCWWRQRLLAGRAQSLLALRSGGCSRNPVLSSPESPARCHRGLGVAASPAEHEKLIQVLDSSRG